MKLAPPVSLREKYYAAIQRHINELFWRTIYAPLIAEMDIRSSEITNSTGTTNPLATAIQSGKIYYDSGLFYGQFTAPVSRYIRDQGGQFIRTKKAWALADFPMQITAAIAEANVRQTEFISKILSVLDDIESATPTAQFDLFVPYEKTVALIDNDLQATVRSISVMPEITKTMRNNIAKEWGANLEIYIKDWRAENIVKLRQEITQNTLRGNRSTAAIKAISENYGVSKRKAKFLARQETSLLLSKMREQRYKDAGSTRYKWSGANDERERPDHKALNGKIISWDSPPVTNKKTGARNHAGADYGCRCVAIAVFD